MAITIESPLSYYLHVGEEQHKQNVETCLQEIAASVSIDRDANAKTVAEYNQRCANADTLSKELRAKKSARNWGIAGIIIAALALIILFACLDIMPVFKAMYIAASIIAAVVFICLLCKKSKIKINALQEKLNEQQKLANAAYQEALAQMHDYNNAFPEDASLRLVEKTMPMIAFDGYFTAERLKHLQAYGLSSEIPDDETVLQTLSGEFCGKPFLYDRRRVHRIESKTYHGSLTIHWTTTSRDAKGNTVTHHHTQTLHASVDKPFPRYYDTTWLYYGHDALPELSFSRTPKFSDDKSEKQLERELRKGERKLRRLEKKELRNGGDFTQVENTEFEILFGATDRSDELDFREMYTMQAQKNTVDLLLSNETYGDDFHYIKQGKLHKLKSAHRQGYPLYASAESFRSHDVVAAENAFLSLNKRFYKDIFFDFAPIMAIPVLQSVEQSTRIPSGEKTHYNYEEYVNDLGAALRPDRCDTECIFKVFNVEQRNDSIHMGVVARGYYGVNRVDFIPKLGGDGRWHNVPVEWVEYIPEARTSAVKLTSKNDDGGQTCVAPGVFASVI